jgi:hypothetical protein
MSLDRKIRRVASQYFPFTGEALAQLRELGTSTSESSGQTMLKPLGAKRGSEIPAAQYNTTTQSGILSAQSPLTKDETPTAPVSDTAPITNQTESPETPFKNNVHEGIQLKNYPKSKWTYTQQSPYYGSDGVVGTLIKVEKEMQALHELAQTYSAKLFVGVHPWPGQLKYDVVDSLQVNIWQKFCEMRCEYFYNTFPAFFHWFKNMGKTRSQMVIFLQVIFIL